MKFYSRVFITATILLMTAALTVQAQTELQRISTTERADGEGIVVRYHMTQLPDSFRVSQPEVNRIEMVLFSMDLDTEDMIPVSTTSHIAELDLYNLLSGVGTDLYIADGVYFVANAYPDVNGRDVLLSLQFATEEEVAALAGVITTEVPPDDDEVEVTLEEEPEMPQQRPAQLSEGNRFHLTFGVQGGISLSNVFNASFNRDARSGMTFGLTIDIGLPYRLPYDVKPSIQTGLHYTEKGFDNPGSRFDGISIEFDYMEIPILAKFNYDMAYGLSPYVALGPYVAFMVSAERVRQDGSRGDLDDTTREVDFGLMGSVGADFTLGATILNAQARGAFAFSDVQKGEFSDGEKHFYMALVLGFRF